MKELHWFDSITKAERDVARWGGAIMMIHTTDGERLLCTCREKYPNIIMQKLKFDEFISAIENG